MTVTTQTQPGSNLWRTVWKLLRLRWVIFTSSFRRGKLRNKIMTIFLGLLLLGGMAVAFVISSALLKFLRSASARRVRGRCESLPGKRTGPGGVGGICADPAGQFWRAAAGAVPGRRYGIPAQRADTDPGCFRHQDDPGYPAILRPDPAVRAAGAVWIGLFRRLQLPVLSAGLDRAGLAGTGGCRVSQPAGDGGGADFPGSPCRRGPGLRRGNFNIHLLAVRSDYELQQVLPRPGNPGIRYAEPPRLVLVSAGMGWSQPG